MPTSPRRARVAADVSTPPSPRSSCCSPSPSPPCGAGRGRREYFIKDSGGRVTVYQGVDSKLGPIDLRHQQESTNIPTADLPEFWRSKVTSGIDASSEKEAAATVERLRAEMVACLAASASGNECTK